MSQDGAPDILDKPLTGPWRPDAWFLCFTEKSGHQFLNAFPLLKFKHVRGFAWMPDTRAWLFVDYTWGGVVCFVQPDQGADFAIATFTGNAKVLKMKIGEPRGLMFRPLTCASALAHFCGLPGLCLTADGLHTQALLAGAKVVVRCEPSPEKPECAAWIRLKALFRALPPALVTSLALMVIRLRSRTPS